MQAHDTLFTPAEAAVLTGLTLKAVNNAIDKKTIAAVAGEEGGRLLDARALVSLALERRLADRVAPELRPGVRRPGVIAAQHRVARGRVGDDRSARTAARGGVIAARPAPRPPFSHQPSRHHGRRAGVSRHPRAGPHDRRTPGARFCANRTARRLSPPHGGDDPACAGLRGRLPAARPDAPAAVAG